MGDFPCVLCDVHPELDDVSGEDLAGRALLGPPAQPLAVNEGAIAALSVLEVELPRLVVEPDESMVSRQHLAVERCVVLGRAAASNRAPDLDWLVQVDMTFLKWM